MAGPAPGTRDPSDIGIEQEPAGRHYHDRGIGDQPDPNPAKTPNVAINGGSMTVAHHAHNFLPQAATPPYGAGGAPPDALR